MKNESCFTRYVKQKQEISPAERRTLENKSILLLLQLIYFSDTNNANSKEGVCTQHYIKGIKGITDLQSQKIIMEFRSLKLEQDVTGRSFG